MASPVGQIGDIFLKYVGETQDETLVWEGLLRALREVDPTLKEGTVCRLLANMIGLGCNGDVCSGVLEFLGFIFCAATDTADAKFLRYLGLHDAKQADIAFSRDKGLLATVKAFVHAAVAAKPDYLPGFGADYFRAQQADNRCGVPCEVSDGVPPVRESRDDVQGERSLSKGLDYSVDSNEGTVEPGISQFLQDMADVVPAPRSVHRALSKSKSNTGVAFDRGFSPRSLGSLEAGEQGTIEVHVSMAATGEHVCTLRQSRGSSVGDLRALIAEATNMPALRQELVACSRVLSLDHELLADLSCSSESALEVSLMVRLEEDFMEEVVKIRKQLSQENNPPIQEAIDAGVVPRFIRYLQETNWPALQFEAGWALTNVASGNSEQTRAVVDNGGVPAFVSTLDSSNKDVQEQAVWALGNIAGDSTALRDAVLQTGALQKLLDMVEEDAPRFPNNVAWTLSNFCRGRPAPPLEILQPILPRLRGMLASQHEEDLVDICWMASYISDGPNERAHSVVETGCVPRLVQLLEHQSPVVQTPALRAVGNIATSDEDDTQSVVDAGFLQAAAKLISHEKRGIRKETCWALSNIMAGSPRQVQAVIDSGLVATLLEKLAADEENFDVKKEIAFAISNPCKSCAENDEELVVQLDRLIELGCVEAMLRVLTDIDQVQMLAVCLGALLNALQMEGSSKDHGVARRVRDNGGEEIIGNMRGHERSEVARLVEQISESLSL